MAGDTFVLEEHLTQLEVTFTYSDCGGFTKIQNRNTKSKATGDSKYIYRNRLDKSCFQNDMEYGDFKDLPRRAVPEILLQDKAFRLLVI